jgi:D-sedoheptulose 7-phosphate isomerase
MITQQISTEPALSHSTQNLALDTYFKDSWQEHHEAARKTEELLWEPFQHLFYCCLHALKAGHKILFFGNGGSAADAQHLATELTARFARNRQAFAALALTTDTSALTAIGNDFGFDHIFSRQIEAIGKQGDVAIGITTSGRSPNVIHALTVAKQMGLTAAAFTGSNGGALANLADPLLIVPSPITSRIQEMHITLGQILCGALEEALGIHESSL